MNDIIDQVLNAAESTPVETAVAQPIEQATTETEVTEPVKAEPIDEPWPTKAQNAYERQKKKVWELKAERKALQAELQKFREQQVTKAPEGAPKAEDYDDYGQFLKAELRHEMKQEQAENSRKQQETQTTAQQQAWIEERQEILATNEEEMAKRIPDYTSLINEHTDEIGSLPEDVRMAALELDNPAAAFYALAKEGKLEWLSGLSPYRAVVELGRAEDRGIAMTRAKPITQAPAPISANKGVGRTGKSMESMSAKEVHAFVNNR